MTFFVIFIGLLVERFFDSTHLRNWQWYNAYEHAIIARLPGKSTYITLAVIIIPLMILAALINMLLVGWLYGLLNLIFSILILLYCLGPRDLWADAFAMPTSDEPEAAPNLSKHFLTHIFIEANRRVFAVVFWFAIFGPMGAVLYRTAALSCEEPALAKGAERLINILDWLPARLLTLLLALGGHFSQVLAHWRKHAGEGLNSNETLLVECGTAALGLEDKSMPITALHKNAISLLDRAFILMLVLVGILVLIF